MFSEGYKGCHPERSDEVPGDLGQGKDLVLKLIQTKILTLACGGHTSPFGLRMTKCPNEVKGTLGPQRSLPGYEVRV